MGSLFENYTLNPLVKLNYISHILKIMKEDLKFFWKYTILAVPCICFLQG